jgi:hypothetical protein
MMQSARIEIRDQTINRTEPLEPYLATDLSIQLNAYYLNLSGALDNLAWAATHEHALLSPVDESDPKTRRFCTLLSKDFRNELKKKQPAADTLIDAHSQWMQDIKEFRDPAAHRLPLTFVSAMLLEDDTKKHGELTSRAMEAIQGGDWQTYIELKVRSEPRRSICADNRVAGRAEWRILCRAKPSCGRPRAAHRTRGCIHPRCSVSTKAT